MLIYKAHVQKVVAYSSLSHLVKNTAKSVFFCFPKNFEIQCKRSKNSRLMAALKSLPAHSFNALRPEFFLLVDLRECFFQI